ncbi:phosphatase PAP2 family protein [Deinococcus roseus]|uniref:Undecaprenyl-diphosphatase BcrC n=1 Tax=Deinococcus roseus TaxID=392414 RepID=A0ABQ2DJ44_9DEIO|nr:phosphatase PAP2 family protein [Deinococcus roseus]GGJ55397.1 undecaprenyl-diphosphatase BcrC [Deinococcus roseus]
MQDFVQHTLHALAVHQPSVGSLSVFFASKMLFVLLLIALWRFWVRRKQLTWRLLAQLVLLGAFAGVLTLLGLHVVQDPRPFMVEGYEPLTDASRDNGFPSDHTLAAALLTMGVFWLDRKWTWPLALGTLLVLLGRLAIGAHHTLDVLGSLGIVALSALLARWLPLPEGWTRKAP